MLFVVSVFKGMTINKKRRLDHESLNHPETRILKYHGYITLSVHSSLNAVGLTAAVSTKFANADISANVIAAYYHDHIFIAERDADKALIVLSELVRNGL